MTVATLGPAGTFSHQLAEQFFGKDILLLPTIHAIVERVAQGGVDGLVPIENSEAGGVGPTLQCLQQYGVYITAEAYVPLRHHLAAFEDPAALSVIYAHPQTHEQCSIFLEEIGTEIVHTSSNAASALAMLKHEHAGAVVPRVTADLYHIPIVRENVQNSEHNVTRFVQLSDHPRCEEGCTKCSILIDPAVDRTGLLYDLLSVFARRNINLTRIESRPSRRGIGNYIFFVDFALNAGWREARSELLEMTQVKELGCYGRREVPGWR